MERGEVPIQHEATVDTERLYGKTLREWHTWLTTDTRTGESAAHLATPVSRYGRVADDCAWWAIAAECIYSAEAGHNDEEELSAGLDFLMGLAVNDHQDIADIVFDYYHDIPQPLHQYIGDRADVARLRDGA